MKSNSWIIVNKNTGEAVFETYNKKVAESINHEKYEALSSHEYLTKLSASLKQNMLNQQIKTPSNV